MHLDYLQEFIVLAEHMNISKAARSLNMTHSNLSKHIRLLEIELKVDLITHGPRVELTPAGLHFLDCALHVVKYIDNATIACQTIAQEQLGSLTIRQPTFFDNGIAKLQEHLDTFRKAFPSVPVRFEWERHSSPESMLEDGVIDAHIIYECGTIDEISDRYASNELVVHKLCDEILSAWLPQDHPLASKDMLTIEDLTSIPILETNQVFHPLGNVTHDLFERHGIRPQIRCRTINSLSEMLIFDDPDAARLFPYSVKDDTQFRLRTSMRLIPVGDENDRFSTYLLMKKPAMASKGSQLFQQTIFEES